MAAPTVNGSAELNGSAAPKVNNSTPQQPNRAAPTTKSSEPAQKVSDENTQRHPPQPKAWTSGLNPITQRSNTPSNANGTMAKPLSRHPSQDIKAGDRSLLDRTPAFMSASVGLECKIITRAGEAFSGIFAGSQRTGDGYKYLFKMIKTVHLDATEGAVNGTSAEVPTEYKGVGSDHSMVFYSSALTSVEIPEAATESRTATPNGAPSAFRTDADISRGVSGCQHGFQRWEAPPENDGVEMSLEPSGDWDQFKTNEQKFGLRSDYDENIYTTTIDRSGPLYAMREQEAARIAREIEGDMSGGAHMREERGHKDSDDGDEEDRYSGVRRNGKDYPPLQSSQPNRYMPPARRAQAASPITPASPVDPAIILSQIARAGSAETSKPQAKGPPKALAKAETTSEVKTEPKSDARIPAIPTNAKEAKPIRQGEKTGLTATENVESEVLDSFRQFAANEKIKVQDHKRHRASAEKSVKINDLKKFSENFKLLTPVPNDLVPILAREESKQKEIVTKAQKNCEESKATKAALIDPKTQRPLAAARLDREALPADASGHSRPRHEVTAGPAAALAKDRHRQPRDLPNRPPHVGLSVRLAESRKLHKDGMMQAIPQPLPIQEKRNIPGKPSGFASALPSPQKAASLRGPPSATSSKFNVKASEFKPNPAANAFKPAGPALSSTAASSPRSSSVTRTVTPFAGQPKFFGDKTKFGKRSERPTPISLVAPGKPSEPAAESEQSTADSSKGPPGTGAAQNSPWKAPYKTHPTWTPPEEGEDAELGMKYWQPFDKARFGRHTSPQGKILPANPATAHQHQLPLHLQNGPNGAPHLQTPQPMPQHMHPQPHQFPHGPQFDDHHQRQPMPNGPMYPGASPRSQHSSMAFAHSPMPGHAQMAYGQPVQYLMQAHGPGMNGRQFSSGGHPQMMPVPAGHHLAPMMVQQPSSGGGYMPQPMAVPYPQQVPMYAGQAPPMFAAPGQPPSGYPSPGRGPAPMMMHQGSHQGHAPGQPVYVPAGQFSGPMYPQQPPAHMGNIRGGFGSPQPHFPQGGFPQPQHPQFSHQPHQPHRTPSAGYVQPHPPHHHPHGGPSHQQGPSPAAAAPNDSSDDTK